MVMQCWRKKLKRNFPKCPSIEEMKESLKHLKNKFSIAAITMVMDFVNQSALFFLRQGRTCKERVDNFRRRLSNAVSIYYQAVKNKVKTGANVTEGKRCEMKYIQKKMVNQTFSNLIYHQCIKMF